jgi:hypothetical protein
LRCAGSARASVSPPCATSGSTGGRPATLLKPALYILVFAGVAVGVGLPLARFNPALALSSFTVNGLRPPWQSVWALLDGYYGFGLVPIDMRNLRGLAAGDQWASALPWTWITLGFALLYLWLYTRRYDWTRVRTPVAFAALSVIWLFLYSKGWSPQFVVWVLAFVVLLRADHGWRAAGAHAHAAQRGREQRLPDPAAQRAAGSWRRRCWRAPRC